jgi:hypothetical protein
VKFDGYRVQAHKIGSRVEGPAKMAGASFLVHSMSWDVFGALMENSYLDTHHPAHFFLELLWVYEAGHFPCGWLGNWPSGKLIVL